MTVNNEPEPRISRGLVLLENLRRTVATFTAREDELTKDLSRRRYMAERKYQNALKDNAARLAKEESDTDAAWKKAHEQMRAFHDGRNLRVEKAERNARRELPKKVQTARGEWLGSLQRQKQRLEKEVGGEVAAADQSLAQTRARLKEQNTELTTLTARAKSLFRGSLSTLGALKRPGEAVPGADTEVIDGKLRMARERLETLRGPLPALSSILPVWLLAPVILAVAALLIWGLHMDMAVAGGVCGGLLVLVLVIHFAASGSLRPAGAEIAAALTGARATHQAVGAAAEARNVAVRQQAQERQTAGAAEIKGKWDQVGDVEADFVNAAKEKLVAKVARISKRNARLQDAKRARLEALYAEKARVRVEQSETRDRHYAGILEQEVAAFDAEEAERWSALESEWRAAAEIWSDLSALMTAASRQSLPWNADFVENWKPAADFSPLAAFASLEVDLAKYAGAFPKDPRLPMPCPERFSLPLALTFPSEGSLLFETQEAGSLAAAGSFTHIILRLLATTPPGRLTFSIFDPAGLGAGFAGLMHLSDYEDAIINRRIWTQRDHIEERLVELGAHIEKVIQMYLRNDYQTITEYNAQAGSVAEKYHFVVAADFPSGFSEIAVKKLLSIATSGPRCGVFTLIHWDQRLPQPDGFVADEVRRNSVRLTRQNGNLVLADGPSGEGLQLKLDEPPDSALALELVHRIGKASIDSSRVQVPFSQIAPPKDELWTSETTNELRVAIGRTGATKHQMLAIGKGTRQHALFAGKTGSGKSTLFHVIITNLALACSPEQVEFYLIDFKKGVEFKCYATQRLPHAKVVAIESDREFALSVLQRVDEELKRRGDVFRKLGVQDVAGYKRAGGPGALPRTLLIIDEFQEFFVDDDAIAQAASLLFDRIVRQGRAFGIHVLLGSQTLGGAYSLARATLGQMAIRVALQCNEADAYLIMDDGNAAPRLLSRPGEGIYNDASGALEGNSPFQVVWLPDDERDEWLHKVTDLAKERGGEYSTPIVFEGNAPADVTENDFLTRVLRNPATTPVSAGRAWLGAPNSIKGPTEAVFHRQSGNHLLIVGQRDEAALNMLGLSVKALAAQYPAGSAKFYFIHSAPPGSQDAEFIEMLAASIPHGFVEVKTPEVPGVIDELATEMKARSSGETQADQAPALFVFIHGVHRLKKLRQEDDFRFGSSDDQADTGSQFNEIINEGSALGIHLILTIDTYNNVNRSLNRKALSEFEMRIVFQMSANDSSSLIDTPAASNLGLHRAIFYNEQAGTTETFRPYAQPADSWWKQG